MPLVAPNKKTKKKPPKIATRHLRTKKLTRFIFLFPHYICFSCNMVQPKTKRQQGERKEERERGREKKKKKKLFVPRRMGGDQK